MNQLRTVKESSRLFFYVVGSCERRFVADRVFLNREEAISYCDSHKNGKYTWAVMKTSDGLDWIDWALEYTTIKTESGRKP